MNACDQEFIRSNVTAVIRSVGERTERLCRALLASQVPEGNIHRVCASPFTEALRRTFQVAVEAGRPWTFVVDADVLVRPGALRELLAQAVAAGDSLFEIEGRVLDKFLDSPREAGNHLYRTAFMPAALDLIPGPFEELRPETSVKGAMRARGYECRVLETVVGLHDFEQSYRDIYRKCFVQGKKHAGRVRTLVPLWEYLAADDADFTVALRAFNDGSSYAGSVAIDSDAGFMAACDDVLRELQVSEKHQLDAPGELDVLWSAACVLARIMRRNNRNYRIKDKRMGVLEDRIRDLENSTSFRLGWALLTPFRLIKDRRRA